MLNIIQYYCHTRTYLARARVVTAGPISAVPAQLLTFPADAAVVLAFLRLSLDGGCRDGYGDEGGKDEGELHVDGYVDLLELRLLWYRSWGWRQGVGRGVYILVLTLHNL